MSDNRLTSAFAVDRNPTRAFDASRATTRVGIAALIATLGLAAASWVVAVWQNRRPDRAPVPHLALAPAMRTRRRPRAPGRPTSGTPRRS